MTRFGPLTHFQTIDRQVLFEKIHQQATLHLQFDVHSCRMVKNQSNKWLFNRGLHQGIEGALVYLEKCLPVDKDTPSELAQILHRLQQEMLDTCEVTPYKAVRQWGLTELEDRLDIEKEDVICGVKHGIKAVTLTLPRLLKGPKLRG